MSNSRTSKNISNQATANKIRSSSNKSVSSTTSLNDLSLINNTIIQQQQQQQQPLLPILTPSQLAAINSLAFQNPEALASLTSPNNNLPPLATPLNVMFPPPFDLPNNHNLHVSSLGAATHTATSSKPIPNNNINTSSTTIPIYHPNVPQISNRVPATTSKTVPAFLTKLYNMVDDEETNEFIHWSSEGKSFFVNKPDDFSKEVLPKFFKHNNFASFVRQLNMYGFRKVPHLNQGVLQQESEEFWEFENENFVRNQPDLLHFVVRKKNLKADEEKATEVMDLSNIVNELAAIKRHQQAISNDLKSFQQENQLLWQESIVMRDRYHRQQQTLDKIVKFLATVFSNPSMLKQGNKKRTFLLGDIDSGSETSSSQISNDHVAKKQKQNIFESPESESHLSEIIETISPTEPSSTALTKPDFYLSFIQEKDQKLQNMERVANDLNMDIDLLEDHLQTMTTALGLDPYALDNIESLDVADLLNTDSVSQDDRSQLLSLMNEDRINSEHISPNDVATKNFQLPNLISQPSFIQSDEPPSVVVTPQGDLDVESFLQI